MDCFSNIIKGRSLSLQDLITCSREHLSPKFDECTTLLVEELDKDSKRKSLLELFSMMSKCSKKVQARNIVEQCSKGLKKVTLGNISKMNRCGQKLLGNYHPFLG